MTKKEPKIKEKKPMSLSELAEKSASKIITDDHLRECIVKAGDEEVRVTYKPLSKKEFLNAQSTQDSAKAVDHILSTTLWNPEKGKKGGFWTVDEINKGIPMTWQSLILNEIVDGSGHKVSEADMDF